MSWEGHEGFGAVGGPLCQLNWYFSRVGNGVRCVLFLYNRPMS